MHGPAGPEVLARTLVVLAVMPVGVKELVGIVAGSIVEGDAQQGLVRRDRVLEAAVLDWLAGAGAGAGVRDAAMPARGGAVAVSRWLSPVLPHGEMDPGRQGRTLAAIVVSGLVVVVSVIGVVVSSNLGAG